MKFAKLIFPIAILCGLAACSPSEADIAETADGASTETQTAAPTLSATNTPKPATATATIESADEGDELLVFASNRGGQSQIYVMQLDGLGQTQVTDSEIDTYFPEFSPDGSILLLWVADFSVSPPVYGLRFWLGPNNISQVFPFLAGTWSPDGQTILVTFVDEGAQNADIGLVSMSGGGFTILTTDLADDERPDWCGESIIFNRIIDGQAQLYLMDADGGNQRPFEMEGTDPAGINADWSPDCSRIAFVSGDETTSQIFVVDADGSDLRPLTESTGHNEGPAWSPDGSQIAFWSDRTGDAEIYLMNADGSSQVNLTNSPGIDESPAWVP